MVAPHQDVERLDGAHLELGHQVLVVHRHQHLPVLARRRVRAGGGFGKRLLFEGRHEGGEGRVKREA